MDKRYQQLPVELQDDIFRITRQNLTQELNTELKRNFCYNCRRYFNLNNIWHIDAKFVDNLDIRLRN